MNLHLVARGIKEAGFMQPWSHLIAHLCILAEVILVFSSSGLVIDIIVGDGEFDIAEYDITKLI